MDWKDIYATGIRSGELADRFFQEQKKTTVMNGWFRVLEIHKEACGGIPASASLEMQAVLRLKAVAEKLPLDISDSAVFAGSQNDAFSSSYALIHPSFKVEEFKGYCDPLAVFNDLDPDKELSEERIDAVKSYYAATDYVRDLKKAYAPYPAQTEEALFFVEQVTGHLIPDFSQIIRTGTRGMKSRLQAGADEADRTDRKETFRAMIMSLDALETLCSRYGTLASARASSEKDPVRKKEWALMAETLATAPLDGAADLYGAIQVFILCWQLMCLEQCPNPYAFSAGNIDRLFEPYRAKDGTDRAAAAGLFQALLAFFNVGDRSWAISQNLLLSGRNAEGADLTNETTYAVMDAFFKGRYPQPILSVRLHRNSPEALYREMGRFFFTPGQLTPSLFNDDSMIPLLCANGISPEDAGNYAVGGCQEPIIAGKENANTTNSWLNLAKVLEVTLNEGRSAVTGRKIARSPRELTGKTLSPKELLLQIRDIYYKQLDDTVSKMGDAADDCSRALSRLRVPFLSCFMGGIDSGIDLRNEKEQGTPYNASGCLIHGLSVLADSFHAISEFAESREEADCLRLLESLRSDFKDDELLRQNLRSSAKFGNNIATVDDEAVAIVNMVADRIKKQKNYLGNPFRPDWASPSTHLLYGYWTGATPDGRKAQSMLGYGVDPLYGEAGSGMNSRMLSLKKLPYEKMNGGCACHLGIDPARFPEESLQEKGLAFRRKVLEPLFGFSSENDKLQPLYLYVNVTTAETLRKVLNDPEKYAPSGVYIMRIHGTFVNFLDLSPAIQEDIILRLDN